MKEEFEIIEFPDIKFEFDKTDIIPGTDHGIENVVGYLNKYPLTKLEIIGHTDSIGSIDYNIDLSMRRAEKIKSLLTEKGINPERLIITGKGETSPATRNKDYWGRTYNRRVAFRLILPDKKYVHKK
jgi:outer membrane protein OmpA-like peptidoglycan-associated protein